MKDEDFDVLNALMREPQECNPFPPLYSPMPEEIQSSYMPYTVNNEYETDAYISQFLDSILNTSDDYSTIDSETPKNMPLVKDSGSCSESDVEVGQALVSQNSFCNTAIQIFVCKLMSHTMKE